MLAWRGMAWRCLAASWAGPAASCGHSTLLCHPCPGINPLPLPPAFVLGIALLAALRAYQSLPQALGAAVGVAGIVAIIAGESKRRQVPAWRPGFAHPAPPACQGCH